MKSDAAAGGRCERCGHLLLGEGDCRRCSRVVSPVSLLTEGDVLEEADKLRAVYVEGMKNAVEGFERLSRPGVHLDAERLARYERLQVEGKSASEAILAVIAEALLPPLRLRANETMHEPLARCSISGPHATWDCREFGRLSP